MSGELELVDQVEATGNLGGFGVVVERGAVGRVAFEPVVTQFGSNHQAIAGRVVQAPSDLEVVAAVTCLALWLSGEIVLLLIIVAPKEFDSPMLP